MSRIKYKIIQNIINILNQLRKSRADGSINKPDQFYKKIYLDNILSQISDNFSHERQLSIFDIGCGKGEIGVELAKKGHDVTGIDHDKPSLNEAERNVNRAGRKLHLIHGDILKTLKSQEAESCDICICLEVLYTCVEYKDIIMECTRIIKNDGLFIASFRTRFYFITTLLLQEQYKKALYISQNSEGILKIASIPAYYNWQSLEDIHKMYSENNLQLLKTVPIGMFSGFGVDGMTAVADVEEISEEILNSFLYEIETSELKDYQGLGRYLLAIGKKCER